MTDVRENYRQILDRIQNAAVTKRPRACSVQLIAVTKTIPVEKIREAVATGVHSDRREPNPRKHRPSRKL